MKLIPIKDIKDNDEFWRGTRFRMYNVGLNVKDKKDDYYEYMLAQIPGDSDHLLLTNVVGYKSGAALALVKTSDDKSKLVVTGEAIKFSIGTEDTFVIKDEFM
jgi:hypothetical protein